ncbi:MAG TPA: B-box zinc finger protein [Alloacidobacterium sp.]|jgi:TM2 domain-containing membrane protein YozV|nr:B-box zinc finger protein [Alloacidobacterium sp.]
MNCANHPDVPVAAYCQNCGKPLCSQCVRSISDVIYCENCLAAKLGIGGASGTAYNFSGTTPGGVNYNISGVTPPTDADLPNPGLAALLGFIPGVGAMYNGQFIKALIHVLVFVVLIGITTEHGLFGIFIAAWIFYQVFDAHQTAKARREGLPLPDPFGLNELGQRLGVPNRTYTTVPPQGPYQAPPVPPPPPYTPADPYTAVPPVPPVPPIPPIPPDIPSRRPEPVGAIVLIIVGMLFLFSTLGVLRFDWIGHGWPLIVIAVGVWLLIRRTREIPPPPAPPTGGGQ